MASRKITSVVCLKNLPKRLSDPLYIGRGSIWGNPFSIGKDGDRTEVLRKFKRYLWGKKDLLKRLPELRGKTLLCFCDGLPCHGHVLIAALAWFDSQTAVAEKAMKQAPHDAHVRAQMLARSRTGRVAGSAARAAL